MDSGYLEPGETMEDEYDFSQALLPEEIIGIIDQLLCQEVEFYRTQKVKTRLTASRWLGTEDIPFHRQYSPACISTDSCHQPLSISIRHYLIGVKITLVTNL